MELNYSTERWWLIYQIIDHFLCLSSASSGREGGRPGPVCHEDTENSEGTWQQSAVYGLVQGQEEDCQLLSGHTRFFNALIFYKISVMIAFLTGVLTGCRMEKWLCGMLSPLTRWVLEVLLIFINIIIFQESKIFMTRFLMLWCLSGTCCHDAVHLGDGLRLRSIWLCCSLWVSVLCRLCSS